MKPKIVHRQDDITDNINSYLLEDVIERLTELSKSLPPKTRFEVDTKSSWGDACGCVYLTYQRPQTEEERVQEFEQTKRTEAYRRQQYEALKKEFEK